jgi:transcriptional regulator with XRE-family HTH domain
MSKRPVVGPALRPPAAKSETLSERIERLRVETGYSSQLELAREMGVSMMLVYRNITLGKTPRGETLEAYARAFHCSVPSLPHGCEEERTPLAVEQYLAEQGSHCPPAVATRLRRIQWSLLTAGQVDTNDVHALRLLIDENLARRASSLDDSGGGPVQTVSGDIPRQTGTRNKQRSRRDAV